MTLRDNILYILEQQRGSYVSGQEIARVCGVSRSAVAKSIGLLKQEGFLISSVKNLGHCLEIGCTALSEYGIRAYLPNTDIEIKVFDRIDSTNSEAKRAVGAGLTADAVFVANCQTAGRGRRGKDFYSPAGTGLYFTAVLHPEVRLDEATAITSATAVAVAKILEEETKKDPKIKWVNDIFIDNKKVCGILTEAVSDLESNAVQAIIIGVGINLTTKEFPTDIKGIAASAGEINRNRLAARIFEELSKLCYALPCKDFMEDYRKYSLVLGKTVYFSKNGNDYTAIAKSITDNGELCVVTQEGEEMVLNSGEISVKLF